MKCFEAWQELKQYIIETCDDCDAVSEPSRAFNILDKLLELEEKYE